MKNMTIRELYYNFADFFPKLEFIFLVGGKNIFFRLQRSSIRVQRSSVGAA